MPSVTADAGEVGTGGTWDGWALCRLQYGIIGFHFDNCSPSAVPIQPHHSPAGIG